MDLTEKVSSLAKRRGFIFQGSEIYGGFQGFWDYGPLGVELKNNIKKEWWKSMVYMRKDVVGFDAAIIMNPVVWEKSGHLKAFTDPLIECKLCHKRFRADKKDLLAKHESEHDQKIGWTEAKKFNLMTEVLLGVTEPKQKAYLRGEITQGVMVNFENVVNSTRVKIPFGIAQIGKAFRNEITPGNFIFRTREFEQAEIEYFIKPSPQESKKWYKYWLDKTEKFYLDLGIKKDNLNVREHDKDELSHYSIGTSDIEYNFPFGTSELAGIAQRTDFDLSQHQKISGQDMKYYNQESGEKYIPYVIEPSMGIDRAMLAFIVDAYYESDGSNGREKGEVVLKLDPKIAPIKIGVFPLLKKDKLLEMAQNIARDLKSKDITIFYDQSGSIGRRYRRQDEIGTPWCVTVDFDSLNNNDVTVRDRDTLKQERIKTSELGNYFLNKLN